MKISIILYYQIFFYIQNLDDGAVIVAGNSDDIFTSLKNHLNYLRSEGLDLRKLQFRGKMAFIFQKGYPGKTIAITKPPGGGNLVTKFQVFGRFFFAHIRHSSPFQSFELIM